MGFWTDCKPNLEYRAQRSGESILTRVIYLPCYSLATERERSPNQSVTGHSAKLGYNLMSQLLTYYPGDQ